MGANILTDLRLVFLNGISTLDPNNISYKIIARTKKSFNIYHEILKKIKDLLAENATGTRSRRSDAL